MLNVKRIIHNVISNYDFYAKRLLLTFESQNAYFTCPHSVTECINLRQNYACCFHFETTNPNNGKTKSRKLPCAFPIMVGSKLDWAFRKCGMTEVYSRDFDDGVENILAQDRSDEDLANIATTCFVLNGLVKQIPFYLTNDVTNIHVMNDNVIRIYTYTLEDKGRELSFYLERSLNDKYERGDLVLRLTSGLEKNPPTTAELSWFFKCPYDVTFRATKTLFRYIYQSNFEIDHLSNKVAFSPGYIFFRLFVKTLGSFIRANDWQTVQRLHKRIVQKSIANGDFNHVISKKTIFYKEIQSTNKIFPAGGEQLCEMGSNNKIFVEKKTTCYRDVNLQNYQLVPFLSQTAYFQISEKAKMKNILSFKPSYIGFLCFLSTNESRLVGRQLFLARNVEVSTLGDVPAVYAALNLAPCASETSGYFVVVNFACIPVSRRDFYAVDLVGLKSTFRTIEVFRTEAFLFVNYKPGMLYKRLNNGLWVTPRDMAFWWTEDNLTFDFLTSYITDMIPYWHHNSFSKNVLALNTIKNSILSRTDKYSRYFKETVSAHNVGDGLYHRTVLPPVDDFSEPWTVTMPKIPVMFTSFRGITQDDCIAMVGNLDSFDIVKTFTLKLKLVNAGSKYFHAVSGNDGGGGGTTTTTTGSGGDDHRTSFLGTLVCRESPLDVLPQSTNIVLKHLNERTCQIYFAKPNFRLAEVNLYDDSYLFLFVHAKSACRDGDKLCSLAGQKGVVRRVDVGPRAYDEHGNEHVPRLLINPESLIKRQTLGQVLEMLDDGADCPRVVNSHGRPVKGAALVGKAFYFIVNYKSDDHIYLANDTVRDKITSQPVRGRSRNGGMKLGLQELVNTIVANGIASCYEEKMMMHSDRILLEEEGLAVPKSMFVVEENMRFFKITADTETEPLVSIVQPPRAVYSRYRRFKQIKRRAYEKNKSEREKDRTSEHERGYKST